MLCDFGLAKVLEDVPTGLTTTDTPACSIRYAAPEVILSGLPHTLQSDVWSWGCAALVVSLYRQLIHPAYSLWRRL